MLFNRTGPGDRGIAAYTLRLVGVLNFNARSHLARVHDVQWVNCHLDCLHQFDCALSEFFIQVLSLADPYTMFPGA